MYVCLYIISVILDGLQQGYGAPQGGYAQAAYWRCTYHDECEEGYYCAVDLDITFSAFMPGIGGGKMCKPKKRTGEWCQDGKHHQCSSGHCKWSWLISKCT